MKRANTKNGKKEAKIMAEFENLASRLSPENLHCDGEISNAEAQRRYRQIMKEWAELEKQLGRKMTEDEVWDNYLKNVA